MKMENMGSLAKPELQKVSQELLIKKYGRGESTTEEVLDRVATGLARNESDQPKWFGKFRDALDRLRPMRDAFHIRARRGDDFDRVFSARQGL